MNMVLEYNKMKRFPMPHYTAPELMAKADDMPQDGHLGWDRLDAALANVDASLRQLRAEWKREDAAFYRRLAEEAEGSAMDGERFDGLG